MPRLEPRTLRTLLSLACAGASGRSARLRFLDEEAAEAEEAVDVLALAFDAPRWLVAAWCRERRSLRVLDLLRVRAVRPTRGRAGAPPDGFDPVDFSVRRFLDPDAGPPGVALLRLGADLARAAPALLPTARLARARGGGRLARLSASRPDVIAALADSLGVEAEVHCSSPMPPARTTRANGTASRRRAARPKATAEARLLGLASFLLEQGDPVGRARIFEAFPDDYGGRPDAAERKFTRDKEALRRLGFHLGTEQLGSDEGQVGYFIDARSSTLPPIALADEEAAVVWTAGIAALRLSVHPLRDDLESALRKLVVGATGFPPVAAQPEALAPEGGPRGDERLEKLVDAWERRKRIRIGYWRVASGAVVEREVDVYGWAGRRGEWIFVGWDHLRGEVRIFYLSRVRSLRVNPKRPQQPDYDVPRDFDVRSWSRQQIWDYRVHAPRSAAVRFRGSLARIAGQLLPGARVTTDASGARVARVEVRNLRGLVRQALAWGPEAELVEPEDGRAMAREMLAALARSPAPAGGAP